MSTTHARLVGFGEQWTLEDARSRNGTFVNGEPASRRELEDGDIIELGHAMFVFRRALPATSLFADDTDAASLATEPMGMRTLLPQLAERFAALKRIAPSRVPLLLLGETGTGKEVLARAVHDLSGRAGPLVSVNCGALPPGLVEAQLFGHKKGAFSGAVENELGFVRLAEGGTLFLDEIGEMPKTAQTALLRVLQDGEVVPVGSARPVRVDARIIAATNRGIDLDNTAFRSDLYARLAGFSFSPPPLRERREDLGTLVADILAAHFPGRAGGVSLAPDAGLALLRHSWPLNIRELEQAICAAVILAESGIVRVEHLPRTIADGAARPAEVRPAVRELSAEDQAVRAALLGHLLVHRGNIAAVGRAMGKAPMQIHRWLRRFEIDPNAFRRG
jgi:transcriptional regulator with GAF, ATPase, and Fis domain